MCASTDALRVLNHRWVYCTDCSCWCFRTSSLTWSSASRRSRKASCDAAPLRDASRRGLTSSRSIARPTARRSRRRSGPRRISFRFIGKMRELDSMSRRTSSMLRDVKVECSISLCSKKRWKVSMATRCSSSMTCSSSASSCRRCARASASRAAQRRAASACLNALRSCSRRSSSAAGLPATVVLGGTGGRGFMRGVATVDAPSRAGSVYANVSRGEPAVDGNRAGSSALSSPRTDRGVPATGDPHVGGRGVSISSLAPPRPPPPPAVIGGSRLAVLPRDVAKVSGRAVDGGCGADARVCDRVDRASRAVAGDCGTVGREEPVVPVRPPALAAFRVAAASARFRRSSSRWRIAARWWWSARVPSHGSGSSWALSRCTSRWRFGSAVRVKA
mmetsp:Transcript_20033/g.62226  ORF Transcript_20033/g.62226 Transcript_20033/m.62226 type:complete len:390 (-) Transcript_20033:1187-2356(-)